MAPGQRTGIATMDADLARCSANVSSWHETDMPKYLGDVRCWVNSGKHLLSLSFSGFDPNRTCDTLIGVVPVGAWTRQTVAQWPWREYRISFLGR